MKRNSQPNGSQSRTLGSKIIRILAYSTIYLILNLAMQFIVKTIVEVADSRILRSLEYRNYLLVALNMIITASLYSGVLSNLEGGLEKFTLKVITSFHKFSKGFIGITGSLALLYYLLFALYYWNIFGQDILPDFVITGWQALVHYFDLYIVQTIKGWFGS